MDGIVILIMENVSIAEKILMNRVLDQYGTSYKLITSRCFIKFTFNSCTFSTVNTDFFFGVVFRMFGLNTLKVVKSS